MRFPIRERHWEDRLLAALWQERGRTGWWLMEVPLGYSKERSQFDRKVDAVLLSAVPSRISDPNRDLEQLDEVVPG